MIETMTEMKDDTTESPETESPDPVEVDAEQVESALEEPAEPSPAPEPEIDWQDRCLRLAAEFDNFRKRAAREYAQIIKNAEEQLIVELTGVLDNLERALDPEHRNAKAEELVKGIELIYGQLRAVLEKRGLVRMTTVGEPFDPEKHEAVFQLDSTDIPEGHVLKEITPGYVLGDKVIRHAKVVVSRGAAKPEDDQTEDAIL